MKRSIHSLGTDKCQLCKATIKKTDLKCPKCGAININKFVTH